MAKKLAFVFILLITNLLGFSQSPTQDSIALKKTSTSPSLPIDSTFVTYNAYPFDSLFLNTSKVVDTTTFHVAEYDFLQRNNSIYSTLSNTGMAHKSLKFNYSHQVGFDMTLPAFSAMMQNESTMPTYQSVLPYSELRYVMTTADKEQHLNVKFGRQFIPRLFVSFSFNTDFSPGTFKNCKTINNYFWVNAHYFTKDNRYGISAYWYRNKLEMGENGGIVRDVDYSSDTESDNSVISVNLSSATNYVVSSGVGFEQYFNLLSQKRKAPASPTNKQATDTLCNQLPTGDTLQIIDSLMVIDSTLVIDTLSIGDTLRLSNTIPIQDTVQIAIPTETKIRKFTLGRICHSFSYLNNKLYYNESSASAAFYQPYDTLLNKTKSTDSIRIMAIRNTLKWNSLGYQKYNDDIPFFVYAGVRQGFYKVKHYDYLEGETILSKNYNQLSVNGGIIVNLFKSTRITGHGELITLGYQIGDFDLKGQWKQYLGTSNMNYGQAQFDVELKRQSANWFEESYYSNHFRWENDFNAATYLTFALRYSYKNYCAGVKQTGIANYIYFGSDARPTQNDGMFSIREAYLSFYQSLSRFEFEGFASLQKSSNEDVVHLPLFQASLKIGYSQPVFHKAATLHPCITVRYYTKYYADAYMPATRTFFLQNNVEIGNFPYIDMAIALKVQKAHIYVAYSNMFLLTGNYDSFIAPHYPMRDSRIFIGVNWRLFN